MSFLKIENAEIGYSESLISEVNLSLNLGEVCLLVGSNGVGKTTLMKSILGQQSPIKGNIFIENRNIKNYSSQEIAYQISMVFSKPSVPSHYTLLDLVSLGKFIYYPYYFELSQKDKNEVEEVIEKLDLVQYKKCLLSELSDGNLQKAFIGRCLVQNTPMIMLDEPTTFLDEENKVMILSLLRKIVKEEQKLILFSSHDWRLAKDFSDKVWWLKDKRIKEGKVLSSTKEEALPTIEELVHFYK